ncbi:MAG: AhpC/TSA family protein [Chlorobi bacterium OLB5]|nr:MAG: AhpC/TSA family protein [Chlorobi bacterium OLB5]
MFGENEYLIVVHNMGKACSYCTLWADGFSGVSYYIEKKAAFVLVSPDTPEVQKEFAESRGWKFKMYSGAGSSFISDMGYYTEADGYWPGCSVFQKKSDDSIRRVAKDYFGPGDFYSAPWHFFDLIPETKETKEQ